MLMAAGVGIGIIPRSSALRHARTLKLRIVALNDAWARRESKIVSRAHAPLPRIAVELIRHLANFQHQERRLQRCALRPPCSAMHCHRDRGTRLCGL